MDSGATPRRGSDTGAAPVPGRSFQFIALLTILFLFSGLTSAQIPVVPTTAPGRLIASENFIRAQRLGIAFIGFVDGNMQQERYRKALILGAGWNRWPLYWDRVEKQSPANTTGRPTTGWLRPIFAMDLKNQRHPLGSAPAFWQEGDSIANLFAPIFADGSRQRRCRYPRSILANPWAQFVHYAVTRYKPGGVLAQHNYLQRRRRHSRTGRYGTSPMSQQFWNGGSRSLRAPL